MATAPGPDTAKCVSDAKKRVPSDRRSRRSASTVNSSVSNKIRQSMLVQKETERGKLRAELQFRNTARKVETERMRLAHEENELAIRKQLAVVEAEADVLEKYLFNRSLDLTDSEDQEGSTVMDRFMDSLDDNSSTSAPEDHAVVEHVVEALRENASDRLPREMPSAHHDSVSHP